ncbi:MAG: hypothetical protein H3C43_06310 [Leptonema sp. (in: Bacteria)]|nr:hypothetical protein [Leptonema sp. (in: bacteria)]
MIKRILNFIVVAVVLLNTLQANPKTDEADPKAISVDVEWSAVSNVDRYRLEIRKSQASESIIEEETTKTKIKVKLLPGDYEKRLGLINKFNKLYLWTDWNPLRIVQLLDPKIEPAAVAPIQRGTGRQTIRLKTNGQMPQTKYYLVDNDGKSHSVQASQTGNDVIIDLNPDELPAGKYDFVMENPEGKNDVQKKLITINFSDQEKSELRNKRLTPWLLLPGKPQRDRGHTTKGNALAISFLSSLALTGYSYTQANTIYSRLKGDPMYQLFSNQDTYNALSQTAVTDPALGLLAATSYDRWQADQKAYNQYRLLTYIGGTLAVSLYAYHIVDVYRFDIGFTRSALGDGQLSTSVSWSF